MGKGGLAAWGAVDNTAGAIDQGQWKKEGSSTTPFAAFLGAPALPRRHRFTVCPQPSTARARVSFQLRISHEFLRCLLAGVSGRVPNKTFAQHLVCNVITVPTEAA